MIDEILFEKLRGIIKRYVALSVEQEIDALKRYLIFFNKAVNTNPESFEKERPYDYIIAVLEKDYNHLMKYMEKYIILL